MKSLIKKNSLLIAGVIVGALAGFLYWHFLRKRTKMVGKIR